MTRSLSSLSCCNKTWHGVSESFVLYMMEDGSVHRKTPFAITQQKISWQTGVLVPWSEFETDLSVPAAAVCIPLNRATSGLGYHFNLKKGFVPLLWVQQSRTYSADWELRVRVMIGVQLLCTVFFCPHTQWPPRTDLRLWTWLYDYHIIKPHYHL
jgi:hypothetical protein